MAYKRKGGSKKRVDEMTRDIKRVSMDKGPPGMNVG